MVCKSSRNKPSRVILSGVVATSWDIMTWKSKTTVRYRFTSSHFAKKRFELIRKGTKAFLEAMQRVDWLWLSNVVLLLLFRVVFNRVSWNGNQSNHSFFPLAVLERIKTSLAYFLAQNVEKQVTVKNSFSLLVRFSFYVRKTNKIASFQFVVLFMFTRYHFKVLTKSRKLMICIRINWTVS